jgi:hypothetical protein
MVSRNAPILDSKLLAPNYYVKAVGYYYLIKLN